MTTLKDIMTADLTTVDNRATLKEVAGLMKEQGIGNVLIMDADSLTGIITDRDIVVRAVAYGHDFGTPASDYATGDVFTMAADTDVQEAAREMSKRQLRRLPVTDGSKVVGIVSLGDLAVRASTGADEMALQGISQPTS
ncbi:CBS domain-containing protein [Deinococcus arenicola]|uniref:CBS domain-containing protein n=1 Tax=Deinococcus arenicola TaxID=2994950 RepID=A0ABU4DRH1_9DEIO|nr:CBS domain-containing protein [Deinococcus sp. ZS9-10]MDV6375032.1 CBS domain-containing protein [Deinococcus sp. ZS9-10]